MRVNFVTTTIDLASLQEMVSDVAPWFLFGLTLLGALIVDRALARWRIRRVARHLGATVERAKGRLFPVLAWDDGPRKARLAFPRRTGGWSLRATVCDVELEYPVRLAFTVKRRGVFGQASLWFWTPTPKDELRTGHDVFDRAFVVRGTDLPVLREWITRDVRRALLRLAGNLAGHTVRFHCDGERVTGTLDGAITDPKALRFFAETTVWLARGVELAAEPQAIHYESAGVRGDSTFTLRVCPACAEPVERIHGRRCDICHAPHHVPCFDYLGGCGIWGCAGGSPRHSPSAA